MDGRLVEKGRVVPTIFWFRVQDEVEMQGGPTIGAVY
jgi:hypothetical protein